jgi:hypothetical protein
VQELNRWYITATNVLTTLAIRWRNRGGGGGLLFPVILDMYVEAINTSITHAQKLLSEEPSFTAVKEDKYIAYIQISIMSRVL